MPRKTKKLADTFVSRSSQLETTRAKMESLVVSGSINRVDVEQVYAGLYLDIFTEFEALIEKLFIGLLSGEFYSASYTIQKKVRTKPASMIHDVVYSGKHHIDWLPYRQWTIPRAEIYLGNGEPFTLLARRQQAILDDYCVIRNAIAHKSDSANAKFQDLIGSLSLLPHEKTPTGYLRTMPSAGVLQTQYEIAVLELEGIAKKLCA